MSNSTETSEQINTKGLAKRFLSLCFVLSVIGIGTWKLMSTSAPFPGIEAAPIQPGTSPAGSTLTRLEVKGRAPKTGYTRSMFSSGWGMLGGCDVRNHILSRDLKDVRLVDNTCKVSSGTLDDPYTGKTILFQRGNSTSSLVQIDHVVALGDAWQKGAQNLSAGERYSLANDPLNLLAVDGAANQAKSDADAASWLPDNKAFRCQYIARQIAVKQKYSLWVTTAEQQAMARVLASCPDQEIPG